MLNILTNFVLPVLIAAAFWGTALVVIRAARTIRPSIPLLDARSEFGIAMLASIATFSILMWNSPEFGMSFEVAMSMSAAVALAVFLGFEARARWTYIATAAPVAAAGILAGVQFDSIANVLMGGMAMLLMASVTHFAMSKIQRLVFSEKIPHFSRIAPGEVLFSIGMGFSTAYPNAILAFLLALYASGILGVINLSIASSRGKEIRDLTGLPFTTILTISTLLTIAIR